jgi:hypothetical protein
VRARAGLALVLVLALPLAGCCVRYRAVDLDTRAKLERRRRFAVLATSLAPDGPWAWAEPASVAAVHSDVYRPRPLDAALDDLPPRPVAPLRDAPEPLQRALLAAREALRARGYEAATEAEGADADLVCLVSLTRGDDGRVRKVAVQVGGPLDDRFKPDLAALDATLDDDASCDEDAADLVRHLVEALPEREDEPPPAPGDEAAR